MDGEYLRTSWFIIFPWKRIHVRSTSIEARAGVFGFMESHGTKSYFIEAHG